MAIATSSRKRAEVLGLKVELADVRPEDATAAFADALPVVATGHAATAQPGQPDDSSAAAALASIRQAVADVIAGRASAVVTNPIAKSVLYRAGFRHPGHTEFLAELAAHGGRTPQPVMMLWSPDPRRGARDHPSFAARRDRAAVERIDRHARPASRWRI